MKNTNYLLRQFAHWAILTLSMSLLLFLVAGTARLASLRHYLMTFSAFLLAIMLGIDPGLAEERARLPEPGQTRDRVAAGLSFLATLMVAAWEVGRLHPFYSVPVYARRCGLFLFAGGMALEMWTMMVNPFFSPDVRLQSERGHCLISCGPYRFLRHPGYLAMLVAIPASALAIGSCLALVPAATFCSIILKRTGAEEKFLERNLAGYPEYTGRVRGRLVPRDWVRRYPGRDPLSGHRASQKSHRGWP